MAAAVTTPGDELHPEELDRVLDGARQPLSEAHYDKLKGVLHAMAAMLVQPRNTEKASAVVETPEGSAKPRTGDIDGSRWRA